MLILTALFASTFPLFLSTGKNLEYEYSVLASFAFWTIPTITLLAKPLRKAWDRDLNLLSLPKLFKVCGIFFLPHFGLYSTGLCSCSLSASLFWTLLNTIPSILLSILLLKRFSNSKLWKYPVVFLGLIFLELLVLLYFPQKRMNSLILGFLHGPIYDLDILITNEIVILRTAILLLCGVLIYSSIKGRRLSFKNRTLVTIMGLSIIFLYRTPEAGHGRKLLSNSFSDQIDNSNYTVFYNKGDIPESRLDVLTKEIDFHIDELHEILSGFPIPKTSIYVYSTEKSKKILFGGYRTDITDVFTPSIHITPDSYPHPTLRHELVHALTSEFAYFGLGFHPNMAITEGLAISLAPRPRTLSLDIGAGSLLATGKLSNVEALFSYNFWQYSGARAYTIAGSLIDNLRKEFGNLSIFHFYSGKSWEESFKESKTILISNWKNKIKNKYKPELHEQYSNRLFRFPGVLHDLCPHSRIDLRKTDPDLWERARQGPFWNANRDYNKWIGDLKKESQAKEKLEIEKATKTLRRHFNTPAAFQEVKNELITKVFERLKYMEDFQFGLLWIDHLLLNNAQERSSYEAKELIQTLKTKSQNKYIGSAMVRAILVREEFASLAREKTNPYILYMRNKGTKPAPMQNSELSSYALKYLDFRWSSKTSSEQTLKSLEEIRHFKLPLEIEREWKWLLAKALLENGKIKEASSLFDWLSENGLPGEREFYAQEKRFADYLRVTAKSKL